MSILTTRTSLHRRPSAAVALWLSLLLAGMWVVTPPLGAETVPPDKPKKETPAEPAAHPDEPPDPTKSEKAGPMSPDENKLSQPALQLIGFTDVNFSAQNTPLINGIPATSGFSLGQFVLHFTANLSSRFTFFGETSLSPRVSAPINRDATPYRADVEQSIIKYHHSDHLKLSAGRFFTPIGYWNSAFHHGVWLQTTVVRPEMLSFGGQFAPIYFIGAQVEGTAPLHGTNVGYHFGVGNGRSIIIGRFGDPGDVNNERALVLRASVKPDRLYGLQAGVTFYRDKLTARGQEFRETMATAYVVWTKENPELIAEYARLRRRPLSSGVALESRSGYVQVAYRLSAAGGKWKPYFRWERTRLERADPFINLFGLRREELIGVRSDVSDSVAVKAEYRWRRNANGVLTRGVFTQVSLTF